MISLYSTTENRFSLYGISHFIEKFGIPVEINKPSPSGIIVAYGVKASGDFVISLDENEIKKNICGKIITQNETLPLCEIPRDTGSGDDVTATFQNESGTYPCVVRNGNTVTIGVDIFKETGYLLSGHLDSIRQISDTHTKKELASKPTVDFLENILFNAILLGYRKRNLPLIQKSFWPEGKKFAVCLTHDVDELFKTYQWISRPLSFLAHGDFFRFKNQVNSFLQKIRGKEPYYTFEDIMGIEKDLGAKSTYFILKESGKLRLNSKKTWYLYGRNRSLSSPEIQSLIRRLTGNGDEVAIHGSFFSYKDPVLLQKETRELEQLLNIKVIGTRQHNLNLEIPASWNYQIEAGLKYDTTLGFKDTIGFRWGTSFPFFPLNGKETLHLLEIPLIIMDICFESSSNKMSDCLGIADEVKKYQGVLTILWHPPCFNTLEYPGSRDIYIKINHYCLEKGAWIARACDIYEWLDMRNKQTLTCEYDISTKTCTIIPDLKKDNQFLTLYLPPYSNCDIRSGNAQVFQRDGDCVYIKTHQLQNNNKIIVGIT
jgi:hypothetical protein